METADVVVVGGGVHGCAVAYHLARLGAGRIVVFDSQYLASGGTGRSAAGVRHQFGTEINCNLAMENIRRFETLEQDLDYGGDIEFAQGGYLLIAYSQGQLQQFERNVALQNSLGIESVMLEPDDISSIAPDLNLDGVLGASFCPRDGHANPFHVTMAYARAAGRLGATFRLYETVEALRVRSDKVAGVVTGRCAVDAPVVVVAAGGRSADLLATAGVQAPIYSERHQILVTEPFEHALNPMVLCFDDGTYWKQTPHGSFLMGIGDPNEAKGHAVGSSWQFLHEVSVKIERHMPRLAGARVVRQWAGTYDITPDSQAIIGPTPVDGLYVNAGWSGHGFQFAPTIGQILAEVVLHRQPMIDVSPLYLERFETGRLIPEPACV
ncbi:MAG: FAD-binding oxidoreductase [Firmicutes bacterium]|nr:FAD-binding oxidoreductase [Bacillota bacterium]